MKILFDNCFPKKFGRSLPGHLCRTTWQMRWDRLANGRLLAAAAGSGFEVFLTIDKNIRHQQNLHQLPLAVIVLDVPRSEFTYLEPLAPVVLSQLPGLPRGQLLVISADGSVTRVNSPKPD